VRASNARVTIAGVALAGLLAGCGVSVTVAGSGPSGSSTSTSENPLPTGGTPTGGIPTGTGTATATGGSSNLPQLSLTQLDSRLLALSDVGSGYSLKYHYDTTHSTTTGLGETATVKSGAASCGDVVNSFDPIPTAGGVKSADYAFSYFSNTTTTGNAVAEWIGAFTGTGAQQALATLQKDYGTCQGFTVATSSSTNIGASEAISSDVLGTTSSFGSPSTADMILWGTASSSSSQIYCATVVGVFGSNLAAVTGCDSSFTTAASLAGQAATAAAAKLGGGNAV
jgi:hypothetical protein